MRSNKYSEDIKFDKSDIEAEYDPEIGQYGEESDGEYVKVEDDENIEGEPQQRPTTLSVLT